MCEHNYTNILPEYEALAQEMDEKGFSELKKAHENGSLDNFHYREELKKLIKTNKNKEISDKLIKLIEEIEKREEQIIRQANKQYRCVVVGMFIATAGLISIIILRLTGIIMTTVYDLLLLSAPALILVIITSHVTLRFYQQSISLRKELLEKKLGTTFLEAALRDDPENGKMYEFGVQMFLQHHITSEPYGSKDKVISINLGDSKK
ncbi:MULTISPECIES: hypothetical protein [Bacteroidales]|uniref:hypothetical protein n=1 Tax=Bacteroidales TaxID=171549 RepID=UPI0035A0CD84